MGVIWPETPKGWNDLQDKVCAIFREMGCDASVEKKLLLARGEVEVDVYVTDTSRKPQTTYICECKTWARKVSQSMVHALRTVVADSGAHVGFMISTKGFQSGAMKAALNSNVKLLTWEAFQGEFYERWVSAMWQRLSAATEPLADYMDVLDDRIQPILERRPDAHPAYYGLFERYVAFTRFNQWALLVNGGTPTFPIECRDPRSAKRKDVTFIHPRDFFATMFQYVPKAITAFEGFIGKFRAR
jgi:hypothetical protein